MIDIKNLELEEQSFWFITRKNNGERYYLKNFKESINGAYWTSDYNLATGYLNENQAVEFKDKHFKDRDEITIVEYEI